MPAGMVWEVEPRCQSPWSGPTIGAVRRRVLCEGAQGTAVIPGTSSFAMSRAGRSGATRRRLGGFEPTGRVGRTSVGGGASPGRFDPVAQLVAGLRPSMLVSRRSCRSTVCRLRYGREMSRQSMRAVTKRLLGPVLRPSLSWLDRRIDRRAQALIELGQSHHASRSVAATAQPSPRKVYIPKIESVMSDATTPFMQYATCSASDFVHPKFVELCKAMRLPLAFRRKTWEFVYIAHHLSRLNALTPGARGVVFGVGTEPLPALFAALGCEVVATDAPSHIAEEGGWKEQRWSSEVEKLSNDGICDPELFRERVSYRSVDMNSIPADLGQFDFCWSACCFEHLGSLQHGLDFVQASVEQCLRPGGIAVHTTEYNLSSNDKTLESPGLSVFRDKDLKQLRSTLMANGHTVSELSVAPDSCYLDQYVDVRPFSGDLHLKLELAGFAVTSAGLVIQGRD